MQRFFSVVVRIISLSTHTPYDLANTERSIVAREDDACCNMFELA